QPSRRWDFGGEPIDTKRAKLRVSVWDAVLGEPVSEVLDIPVVDERQIKRERHGLRIPQGTQVSIRSGAHPDTPMIARASGGAVLNSDAIVGDWRRVVLKKGIIGFVESDAVKVLPGPRKNTTGPLAMSSVFSAPAIDLELDELVTGSSTLRLTGTVHDVDGVRDVFVFLNDKKVYYKSFDSLAPSNGKVRADLNLPLKLKEGSNAVAVVARKSDELVSRRLFGVYRAPNDAVAERSVQRKTAAQ
ncbi:MAG: hypothetical protein AAFP04_16525, partial [Myxococcota bacterium]